MMLAYFVFCFVHVSSSKGGAQSFFYFDENDLLVWF